MPYWNTLGRCPIAQDSHENADRISAFLNYSGLDATVSSNPETSLYTVTVPSSQQNTAERLIGLYAKKAFEAEESDRYYRENFLNHSPTFIPSEEKFRTATNSSTAFLCAGGMILLMALAHVFLVLLQKQDDSLNDCLIELFFGLIFTLFGITTHQKVRLLRSKIQEENDFTNRIVHWYTTVYPAEHLDKYINAAAEDQAAISEEERFFLRRQLIQNYILREYDIEDTAYLDYVTDLIYKKLYFPNAVSSSPH